MSTIAKLFAVRISISETSVLLAHLFLFQVHSFHMIALKFFRSHNRHESTAKPARHYDYDVLVITVVLILNQLRGPRTADRSSAPGRELLSRKFNPVTLRSARIAFPNDEREKAL